MAEVQLPTALEMSIQLLAERPTGVAAIRREALDDASRPLSLANARRVDWRTVP